MSINDRDWLSDEALASLDAVDGWTEHTLTDFARLAVAMRGKSLLSARARAVMEAVEATIGVCDRCYAEPDRGIAKDCNACTAKTLDAIRRAYLSGESAETYTIPNQGSAAPLGDLTVHGVKPPCHPMCKEPDGLGGMVARMLASEASAHPTPPPCPSGRRFIVNGVDCWDSPEPFEFLRDVMSRVLAASHNIGRSVADWQCMTVDGRILDVSRRLADLSVGADVPLLLNLRWVGGVEVAVNAEGVYEPVEQLRANKVEAAPPAGMAGELATAQPPKAHKTSHENGGSDEISVAGLSGTLTEPMPCGAWSRPACWPARRAHRGCRIARRIVAKTARSPAPTARRGRPMSDRAVHGMEWPRHLSEAWRPVKAEERTCESCTHENTPTCDTCPGPYEGGRFERREEVTP